MNNMKSYYLFIWLYVFNIHRKRREYFHISGTAMAYFGEQISLYIIENYSLLISTRNHVSMSPNLKLICWSFSHLVLCSVPDTKSNKGLHSVWCLIVHEMFSEWWTRQTTGRPEWLIGSIFSLFLSQLIRYNLFETTLCY